ncbi:hypothetical protein AGOR_G00107040 [Albula goreensis]|uniref:C2HC/C3H-type domain-containing protein n=1 Tax=Albula goreensis TaxID=1534307 RepID=A0A8T3DI39_9TELE|nr:hypothetical protein AGOR_G00107040 [Albula goreensis]
MGKLPPLCQDGRSTSQHPLRLQLVKPDVQQEYLEDRERKMIAIYERQQQTALEKVRQMFQHNKYPLQRQYHSARDRYDNALHDEQDYESTMRKASAGDKTFPLKPVYHKRAYSLSNIYRPNELEPVQPLEAQRLPHHFPAPSLDYPDRYDGRSGHRGSGRQLPENQCPVIPTPSSFGEASTRDRGRGRGSQWLEGRLEEDQMRLEEQIRRKEIVLQQKLRRVVEELGKIQREKYSSGGKDRRERSEVEQRGKWDKEQERRESEKATYAEQERWERLRERREREKDREQERREREVNRERERREREQERDRLKEEEWEREKWDRERAKANELVRERREWERERREREWERAQRRWSQEKHRDILQRMDPERNTCSGSSRSIPPDVKHRRPMHIVEETTRQLQVEVSPDRSSEAAFQLLPCRLCHRNFAADRLQKHHEVCEKVQHSTRKVFDSSKYRAKGTDLEEYMKTNSRRKTPEVKKSNWRQKHETFIRNLRQARMPVKGASRSQLAMDDPDYQTCPHCARRFAPGPAERHIPKCQNIRSRPPPPRRQYK